MSNCSKHILLLSRPGRLTMLIPLIVILALMGSHGSDTEKCPIRDFVCQKARGQEISTGKIYTEMKLNISRLYFVN